MEFLRSASCWQHSVWCDNRPTVSLFLLVVNQQPLSVPNGRFASASPSATNCSDVLLCCSGLLLPAHVITIGLPDNPGYAPYFKGPLISKLNYTCQAPASGSIIQLQKQPQRVEVQKAKTLLSLMYLLVVPVILIHFTGKVNLQQSNPMIAPTQSCKLNHYKRFAPYQLHHLNQILIRLWV